MGTTSGNNSVLPKIVPNSSDFQSLAGKSADFLKSVFSTGELPKLADFSRPVANGSAGTTKDSTESDEEDFVVVDSGGGDSQLDLIRLEGPTLLAPGTGPRRLRPRNLVIEGSCNYFFWMEKIAMVSMLTLYQKFRTEFK